MINMLMDDDNEILKVIFDMKMLPDVVRFVLHSIVAISEEDRYSNDNIEYKLNSAIYNDSDSRQCIDDTRWIAYQVALHVILGNTNNKEQFQESNFDVRVNINSDIIKIGIGIDKTYFAIDRYMINSYVDITDEVLYSLGVSVYFDSMYFNSDSQMFISCRTFDVLSIVTINKS